MASKAGETCQLFVHGVELLTKDDLKLHFSNYGKVTNVDLPPSALTPRGYKYGFIWFGSASHAEAAYNAGELEGFNRRHFILGEKASAYVNVCLGKDAMKTGIEQVMS